MLLAGKNYRLLCPKLKTLGELKKIVSQAKEQGKKVALANGGFDLLHAGHVRYLQEAKNYADILIVAINSDRSLRRLKGLGRPLIPCRGRILMLAALQAVDYLLVFSELTVENVLRSLQPDFHCKGSDYSEETVPERETVRAYGGKVLIVGGDKIFSTSQLIERIRQFYG